MEAKYFIAYCGSVVRVKRRWWRHCIHHRTGYSTYFRDLSSTHNSECCERVKEKEDVWDVYSGGVAQELRYSPTERARAKGGEQDPTAANKEMMKSWGVPALGMSLL